ncbi:MAG TPA: hypothetical protein DEQ14_05135 [Treponema sp.]|nr:hypothetical protein [Treponema sp.]
MNKDNFFIKFAYLYVCVFENAKEHLIDVWYAITDSFFWKRLITIIVFPIRLSFDLIFIFFPLKILLAAALSVYLSDEELRKLEVDEEAGYYLKGAVKKRKLALKNEARNGDS